MDESHIEHTICLIEDKYLDICERDMFLSDEIEESPWSGDEDIDSLLEGIDLRELSHSSEYDSGPEFRIPPIGEKTLLYLDCEFASWCEDERADFSPFLCSWSGTQTLDNRKGKCCCLPSSCLCTTKEICSLEDNRYRLFLDRSRSSISLFGEGLQDWFDQVQIRKEHGN